MSNHVHSYRLIVTKISGKREIGIESFRCSPPKYGFICECGDVKYANLETAAEHGWVYLNDLTKPEA